MIVSASDFIGLPQISQSNQFGNKRLQEFLTQEQEHNFIYKILGIELGQEFINDLNGDPQTPISTKWIAIFNNFNFYYYSEPQFCIGIKYILVQLFYNDFVTVQSISNQINGNVSVRGEATDFEGGLVNKTTVIYNRTVNEIQKLQYYVNDSPNNYENFKGVQFQLQSGY